MIKNAIIIILILLLIITLYSYYCLSSKMSNFERTRLEYILQKETELKTKESNIQNVEDCANKNNQLKEALENINNILVNINIGKTFCTTSTDDEINSDIIKGIENVISRKIDPNIVAEPENIESCINKIKSEE